MKLKDIQAAAAVATTKPQAGLEDQLAVVYGEKNVGKSTFCSRYTKPIFFDFEDRLRNITLPDDTRPAQLQFDTWDDVTAVTDALLDSNPEEFGYTTIVIDGAGLAFKLMLRKLLTDNDVESWNDGALGYMKGRDIAIKRWSEWFQDVRALTRIGFHVVITAHESMEVFEHNGVTNNRKVPLVAGVTKDIDYGWQAMRASIDMIIHVSRGEIDGKPASIMRLHGTNLIEAADPTPDGRLPAETVFSYKALAKFWDAKKEKKTAKPKATAPKAETTKGEQD